MLKIPNHEPKWHRGVSWSRTVTKWIVSSPVLIIVVLFYIVADLLVIVPWFFIAWIWNTKDQDILSETLAIEWKSLREIFGPTRI